MRISVVLSLVAGVALFAPTAVSAAPLALSEHVAMTKSLGAANAGVQEVGVRRKVRRSSRRYARRGCSSWTCRPYWRPYQYRYWQLYYPYGGPLF